MYCDTHPPKPANPRACMLVIVKNVRNATNFLCARKFGGWAISYRDWERQLHLLRKSLKRHEGMDDSAETKESHSGGGSRSRERLVVRGSSSSSRERMRSAERQFDDRLSKEKVKKGSSAETSKESSSPAVVHLVGEKARL